MKKTNLKEKLQNWKLGNYLGQRNNLRDFIFKHII